MKRANVAAQTRWAERFGYSRAVRVGPWVHVSGTTAVDGDGQVVGKGDAYAQALRVMDVIEAALTELGARVEDIVRTRVFVTDITDWPDVARAHHARLGHVLPASSLVEVACLLDPDLLLEIEADAYLPEGSG